MERPLRGPDLDRPFLDSREAAAWIGGGIGEKSLEDLMVQHLPTVRAVHAGKRKLWKWEDIAVLAYVMGRGGPGTEESEGE